MRPATVSQTRILPSVLSFASSRLGTVPCAQYMDNTASNKHKMSFGPSVYQMSITKRDVSAQARMKAVQPSEPAYGPRALLLGGFSAEEQQAISAWFHQMEPTLNIIEAKGSLLSTRLSDALQTVTVPQIETSADPNVPQDFVEKANAFSEGKVCLLSGFTGEETLAIVSAWEEFTRMPAPIFGSNVPSLSVRPVRGVLTQLVEEADRHLRVMSEEAAGSATGRLAGAIEEEPTLIVQNGRVMTSVKSPKDLRAGLKQRMEEKGLTKSVASEEGEKQTSSKKKGEDKPKQPSKGFGKK